MVRTSGTMVRTTYLGPLLGARWHPWVVMVTRNIYLGKDPKWSLIPWDVAFYHDTLCIGHRGSQLGLRRVPK